MDKQCIAANTRYTVALRDASGKPRPANFCVLRLYDEFMIVRMTDRDGLLRKLAYADVLKIVKTLPTADSARFLVPDALLAEKVWKDRAQMEHYSSSPALGK